MKQASPLWTLIVGRWTLVLSFCFAPALPPAFAFTADKDNPYATIVERNAFALKPPTPPVVATPPAPAASNVELRGITTLLGRPQVLLNFKMPGKPPEPPKDRSLVMDVGQREGEVEVLEINPATGSIRIRNQGNELAMNLKDNAPKPQFTPSLAAPGIQPPGVPSVPGVPAPPSPNPAMPGIPPSNSRTPTPANPVNLPTRQLRSTSTTEQTSSGMVPTTGLGGVAGNTKTSSYQPPNTGMTAEQQIAVMTTLQSAEGNSPTANLNPPIPPKYRPQ